MHWINGAIYSHCVYPELKIKVLITRDISNVEFLIVESGWNKTNDIQGIYTNWYEGVKRQSQILMSHWNLVSVKRKAHLPSWF